MVNHTNRGRLVVDTSGNWALYAPTLPTGAVALGTVTRTDGDTGALIRFERTGQYAQVNAGAVRTLDGRKVSAAIGTHGRPSLGTRRINVTLDDETVEAARALGNGNLSEGLREAVRRIVRP